jgi:hypothetical protein
MTGMSLAARDIASTLLEKYTDAGICDDTNDEFHAKVGKLVDQLIGLKPPARQRPGWSSPRPQ